MQQGSQHFPHKYIKRVWKDGRWDYSYAEDPKSKKYTQAPPGTREYKVVIAHGKPTSILVAPGSDEIVFGPPQTKGKKLFINTNPNKTYFGIARSENVAVYLYPEDICKRVDVKKSAKFLKSSDALTAIDAVAEDLMRSEDMAERQYGVAMWLNNNSALRVGAHSDAGSVDAVERRRIINQARVEKWSEKDKYTALENAKKPTFGLLTLRAGHVNLNPNNMTVSFNFRGKGGKMITDDTVAVKLRPLQYSAIYSLVSGRGKDERVFPDVVYKRMWRYYKKFGVTPHISRGKKADEMINALMKQYKVKEIGGEQAWRNFQGEVKTKISDQLGHSVSMTQKAYISPETRAALEAFKTHILDQEMMESEPGNIVDDGLNALARVVTWFEIGPGNEVI